MSTSEKNDTCHEDVLLTRIITAPLMKDVDIKYAYTSFNGSFLKETVYRRDASPEVDAAWEALGVDCKSETVCATP